MPEPNSEVNIPIRNKDSQAKKSEEEHKERALVEQDNDDSGKLKEDKTPPMTQEQ